MLKIKLGKKISNLKILQKKKKNNNQNNEDEFYQEKNLQMVELQNKKYNLKIILNYKKIVLKRMETKFDKAKLNDDEIETKI